MLSLIEWQDRFRITAILGAHLGTLGTAALLLFMKGVSLGGLYDTCASGGGDIRLIKDTCVTLNPYVLGRYLPRAPLGSQGWIMSINNMEDLLGGHSLVRPCTSCGTFKLRNALFSKYLFMVQ